MTTPNFDKIPSLSEHHYYMFFQDFSRSSVQSAVEFVITRNLMIKKPDHIKFLINSPGGEVSSAFALIDTVKGSKVPVHTYGLGEISSCGLLFFIAGAKGHRYVTKNTSILSHQYSWGGYGKHHELMARVAEYELTHNRMVEHYKKCTGMSEANIKKYLLPEKDVWISAKDAVKFGIADEVVDFY